MAGQSGLNEVLSRDMIKVMYRGIFTKKQAALYLGKGVEFIDLLIEKGELGCIPDLDEDGTVTYTIPREECDKWIRERTRYKRQK